MNNIHTIITILSAYPVRDVKEAVKTWAGMNVSMRLERKQGMAGNPWRPLREGEDIPPGHDRMTINGQILVRKSPAPLPLPVGEGRGEGRRSPVARASHPAKGPTTETTPAISERKCPVCGAETVYEPICPGCKLGQLGFAGRYICLDDPDHEHYVPRPGIDPTTG